MNQDKNKKNNSSSKKQQQQQRGEEEGDEKISWRRDKVQELLVKGHTNHYEIATIMQIPRSTITKDIIFLRQQAKQNVAHYIDEKLPEEYSMCFAGFNEILKQAWITSEKEDIDAREKLQALSLAKEIYSMKLDLLSNVSTVETAMKFISDYKNNNNKSKDLLQKSLASNQENDVNDFSSNDIEEEETTATTTTTNKVF